MKTKQIRQPSRASLARKYIFQSGQSQAFILFFYFFSCPTNPLNILRLEAISVPLRLLRSCRARALCFVLRGGFWVVCGWGFFLFVCPCLIFLEAKIPAGIPSFARREEAAQVPRGAAPFPPGYLGDGTVVYHMSNNFLNQPPKWLCIVQYNSCISSFVFLYKPVLGFPLYKPTCGFSVRQNPSFAFYSLSASGQKREDSVKLSGMRVFEG